MGKDIVKDMCCDLEICGMLSQDIMAVPAVNASIMSLQLPVTDAQLQIFSGARISIYQGSAGISGFTNQDAIVNTFACPFLIRGFSVRLVSGPRLLSLTGYAYPTPTSVSDVPALTGPPAITDAFLDATLSYNMDAAEAVFHFAQAYNLRVMYACNNQLLSERIADFGVVGAPDSFCGFGNGMSPIQNIIAEVNNYYVDRGIPMQFVPAWAVSSGCCGGAATAIAKGLANVQWGGPCLEGQYGGIIPAPMCTVVTPGNPLSIYLEVYESPSTAYHLARFRTLISNQGEETIGKQWNNRLSVPTTVVTFPFGGTVTPLGGAPVAVAPGGIVPASTISVSTTGVVTFLGGASINTAVVGVSTTVLPGQTNVAAGAPAGTVAVASSSTAIGKSSVWAFKGGTLDIEIDVLGYDLETPQVLKFFCQYGKTFSPAQREMYATTANGYLTAAAASHPKLMQALGVAGVAALLPPVSQEA